MAMVAMQQTSLRQPHPSSSHAPSLTLDTSKFKSPPIPNKHLPHCPTGPAPSSQRRVPTTPPGSPPSKHSGCQMFSLLNPATTHTKVSDSPPVYSITASTLAKALDCLATQHFPDPKQVFPWLHGLHPENRIQLAYFFPRRKSLNAPRCFRGLTIVKVGDLSKSRLKGALDVEELLSPQAEEDSAFVDIDPRDGFSVRNFHIQAAKMARVSDIVVYGDDESTPESILSVAKRIAVAQMAWTEKSSPKEREASDFNTFVVSSPFHEFEKSYPSLVAVDSKEQPTGKVIDFFRWERQEMCNMSKASEISHNVWLGPTPDSMIQGSSDGEEETPKFDIFIEANDLAQALDLRTLNRLGELSYFRPQHFEFPSSGSIMPPTRSNAVPDIITDMCQWMYRLANPQITPDSSDNEQDAGGDIQMKRFFPSPRKILIHCADGYTDNSLLGLAYLMYAEGVPTHDAWLRLHCEKKRNFFAYSSDVALLGHLQPRLLESSPRTMNRPGTMQKEPAWLSRIDGSLPSRILSYMYLGNLGHANNPELLQAMGITRILSIGEPVDWTTTQWEGWGTENVLLIDRVQDNGVDPLMNEFERCLDFIATGKTDETATLVHCRVGVSRSATICIAEVMASLGMSFPRAYCFVRARRLNVIIQPHLRFAYELLKWDEVQQQKRGEPIQRELEWATIAREIAAMNKPYSR